MTKAFLPQDDPEPARRVSLLEAAREDYVYDHDTLAPLALVRELPAHEHFDTRYNVLQLDTKSRVAANMAATGVRHALQAFTDLSQYEDFYPLLPRPAALLGTRGDRSFAQQRVAGANPMVLRRVAHADELEALELDEERFGAATGLASLADGVAAGRLFLADYRGFASTVAGTHDGRPKWVAPAMALFFWRQAGVADRGGLAPVAIRLSSKGPALTPQDGAAWQAAKLHVQVADANHHEMSTHLGRTHLVLEPFAVATARQLAPRHPLRLLLAPHLRFTLAINSLARLDLIRQDGPVDRLLAGTLASSLRIATTAASSWHFEDFKLPAELRGRGVDDQALLPDYPYRDDGLLLWEAIGAFALDYLRLYYRTPAELAADAEVRAWLAELAAADGGRVRGLPALVSTVQELAAIAQQVIFTSGPQHSAINFSQWDFLGAPSNMPLAAYAAPEALPTAMDDPHRALLPILPPADQVREQIEVIRFLSGWHYDRLGTYPRNHFEDGRAIDAVSRFQAALDAAERRIQDRNTRRSEPYEYLRPSRVLNSSSI